MSDQLIPNVPNTDRLRELLHKLSMQQIRYMIARVECKSDKEAAELIGISPGTVKNWENKSEVDEAITLYHLDGVITALEIRRRHLAEAMAVKASGMRSEDERVRQAAATEIIEWELGRAAQKQEFDVNMSGTIAVEQFKRSLDKVYGSD